MRTSRPLADPAVSRLSVGWASAISLTAIIANGGCGASVSSIYEGDVRFEHCMALDARPAVNGPQRRQCWIEWVRYYTYGQTQDRVEYAVAHASGTERVEKESESPVLAAPEPTSAFAPPPMMIQPASDAGTPAPPPSTAGPPGGADEGTPAGRPLSKGAVAPHETPSVPIDPSCQADCAEARADCRTSCQGGSCEKSCSGKHNRCLERCAEVRAP